MAVNTIIITEYNEFDQIRGTETLAKEVADLFRKFELKPDTPAVAAHGHLDGEQLRSAMKNWASSPRGSVIYWLGHGCGPAPGRLVHSESAIDLRADGVVPAVFADHVDALGQKTPFVILILEACESEDFVNALRQELRTYIRKGPILILFPRERVTVPRSVLSVLNTVLNTYRAHDEKVFLADLYAEFEKQSPETGITAEMLYLGDAALLNPERLPPGQTVEVHRQLLDVLNALSDDERQHFFRKAQGAAAEHPTTGSEQQTVGELTWNFEGRDRERRVVRGWIDDDRPLCVIGGAGGQGKSAFLGDIVTRCRPELANALVRANLMNADPTWADVGLQRQAIAINASGLTTERLLNRALDELNALTPAADAAGLGATNEAIDADPGDGLDDLLTIVARTADAVTNALHQRILFIIDGIDEMQDPHEGARIIASLATKSSAKVLAATRDQPNDGQSFLQYANADLTQVIRDNAPHGTVLEVRLHTDPEAIDRYLRRRLAAAFSGTPIPIPGDLGRHISDFLHAQLIIGEVVAEPEWLTGGLLPDLAAADITNLYASMLDRLEQRKPAFKPIFQACALAQGRGIPAADDVWLTVARAIDGEGVGPAAAQTAGQAAGHDDGLTPKALSDFIDQAQAHIRIDREHDQTVFRPAHALLREFVLSTIDDVPGHHSLLAELCAEQAASPATEHIVPSGIQNSEKSPGEDPWAPASNVYYKHAATMHARQSAAHQGWWRIDRLGTSVWQHLDQQRIVEDAMRDLFGRTTIPPGVEKVILSHHHTHLGPAAVVLGWAEALREGSHRPSKNQQLRKHSNANPSATVRWARDLARQPVFLSLPGHRGRITALHPTRLGPEEPGLLVGTSKGDVWLWNLQRAVLVASLEGLNTPVFALSSLVIEKDLIVTAGDSSGRLVAWSAKTRQQLWNNNPISDAHDATPIRKHSDAANPVTAVRLDRFYNDLPCAVTVHHDRIRVLDASNGELIGATPTSPPTDPRYAPKIATSIDGEGRHTLAVPARDTNGYYPFTVNGQGEIWTVTRHDLVRLPAEIVAIRPHPTTPNAFRHLTNTGQITRSSPDAEPNTQSPDRAPATDGTSDGSRPITTGDLADPGASLTQAHVDPDTGLLQIHLTKRGQSHEVHASHGNKPSALTIIERPTRPDRPLIATGASDRTVRVWDPYSAPTDKKRTAALARHVHSLPAGNQDTLAIAVDRNGRLQFINGTTARPIQTPNLGAPVTNLASSTDMPGRALIAAATRSGTVHLWKQRGLEAPENLIRISNLGVGATVDINPPGTHIAVADNDCFVTLWEHSPKNTLLLNQALHDTSQRPIAVKLHRPYEDLVVILVFTERLVQTITLEGIGRRRRTSLECQSHNIPDLTAYSLYIKNHDIGLVAGSIDGQASVIPNLWTPKGGISIAGRKSIPALNLQQPVTAIHALQTPTDPLLITTCGAHGRIKTAQTPTPASIHTIELGQPITAAHTHKHGQLLAAVLGGTTFLDLNIRQHHS